VKHFDLNLLRVLVAVYDARSVSRAALVLGTSQPTVSSALGKLRRAFGEPLFVKTAHGVSPTARTHAIAASARAILSQVEAELLPESVFDPASTTSLFTLAMSDVGEMVFLPKILARLQSEAPGASVRSVALPPEQTGLAMEAGEIDLAIGYFPDLDSAQFRKQQLFQHYFVCLLRADHPLSGPKLTMEQFLDLGHAVIRAEGRSQEIFEKYLERHRIERRIVLHTPHFMSIPMIIGQSDLVVTLPHAIGQFFSRIGANVRIIEPPLPLPPISLFQHWHGNYHHEPRNRWLRVLMAELFNAATDEWPYPFVMPERRKAAPSGRARRSPKC
jgi:DNA-binding transcriptional LysR family regulator